jgi:lambda family phage minor tail protein L
MPSPYENGQLKKPTKAIAESSIKSLNFELTNLTPSALITLIEIDLQKLLTTKHIENLSSQAKEIGFKKNISDAVLRFHNNIKIINSYVVWQNNTYYPAPILTEGFETSSKGTLPQPTLSIVSQSETGADQIALLKHEIRKFGDIIGAKVTRRRTFAKYLDADNFLPSARFIHKSALGQQLPVGYEPDPYAELPTDVYYIERKISENKSAIKYQLSSVLDLEGIKLPKRMIVSDKCMWQYRGCGCWYQHAETLANDPLTDKPELPTNNSKDGQNVPVLRKAGLKKLPTSETVGKLNESVGTGVGLPTKAPPVADDNDEKITEIIGDPLRGGLSQWSIDATTGDKVVSNGGEGDENYYAYYKGISVFLYKDDIKYYFVAKRNMTKTENKNSPPPNTDYWVADECSKTLTGCRLRWGLHAQGGVENNKNGPQSCAIIPGKLPFGGFPAARKIQG